METKIESRDINPPLTDSERKFIGDALVEVGEKDEFTRIISFSSRLVGSQDVDFAAKCKMKGGHVIEIAGTYSGSHASFVSSRKRVV